MKMSTRKSAELKERTWILDDNDDNEDLSKSHFANVIAAKSRGKWETSKKKYNPLRDVYYSDPKYNPPLLNTHLSNEFDSQILEIERNWKKSGSKFETKLGRFDKEHQRPGGPLKPESLPKFFEKSQKMFGRDRKVQPFLRAQVYTRPDSRYKPINLPSKGSLPSFDLYNKPDKWAESSTPSCGIIR